MKKVDFLVIGSGIAGLTYALKVAKSCPDKRVCIITKSFDYEGNTNYAQGGVAVVTDFLNDSFDKHIEDTLIAGNGLCDEDVVNFVIKEGPERIQELISWGMSFDKEDDGSYHLGREGGHSENRVMHHSDLTGKAIQGALLNQVHRIKNIEVFSHHFATDLIQYKDRCIGAKLIDLETFGTSSMVAKITLIATGGAGHVYNITTNPIIATGDGIAMADRIGAKINNMEFVQFHPTALYNPGDSPVFLISEAVRGFGAILRSKNGNAFMSQYDDRGDLAPRDTVARAVENEMKEHKDECVYLDARHLDLEAFEKHFPNITRKCKSIGLNLAKDMIPVVPAAHYICGGVTVDYYGRTSINNLYACGECAYTGLHGANRLASNSLLEAIVYSERCHQDSIQQIDKVKDVRRYPTQIMIGIETPDNLTDINNYLQEIKALMSKGAGVVRTEKRLIATEKRLSIIQDEVEDMIINAPICTKLWELRNIVHVGLLIIHGSIKRKESIGLHFLKK